MVGCFLTVLALYLIVSGVLRLVLDRFGLTP